MSSSWGLSTRTIRPVWPGPSVAVFREVGRNSLLVLDLGAGIETPDVDPPDGVLRIVSWAKRPDLSRGIYDVAREAYPDVPGAGEELAAFEDWLSVDMQSPGDRPEATFLALAGDEVVGYAEDSRSAMRGPASRPTT